MRLRRIRLVAAALGWIAAAVLVQGALAAGGGPAAATTVVAGYFASFDRSLPVPEIDASRLTDVIYAFGQVDAHGRCQLADPAVDVGPDGGAGRSPGGDFGALAALEEAHPGLRAEISIGGWDGSAGFSRAAASGRGRALLVRSCIDLFLRRWPGVFDGIDIDWEFPVVGGAPGTAARPGDRTGAALLLADFRHGLDALAASTHRRYLLTVAMPAFGTAGAGGGYSPSTSWDLPALARQVDWMNLMTYDLAGAGSATTGFASPLHVPASGSPPGAGSIDGAVRYYEAAGVPAREIVIGAPFYGHVFVGVHSRHRGLFERFRRLGGVPSYALIAARRAGARDVHWSAAAQEPWIYDRRTHRFLTYDDPAAMSAKAHYAVGHHLRGVMLWELAMDDARHSLLDALSGPVLAASGRAR